MKGTAILVTGNQPPVVFEAAGFAFPIALLGLHALLASRRPVHPRGGGATAAAALVVGLAALGVGTVADHPPKALTTAAIVTVSLCTVASLLLLGGAARRSPGLPERWKSLPWFMGLAIVPSLTIVGGLLAAVHERLLEIPIVALGVAWVLLGLAMLDGLSARTHPRQI